MPLVNNIITQYPDVTFLKGTFRRHTNVIQKKDTYYFNNNRLIIPAGNEIDTIRNIWISNVENNLKFISMFIVDENIDPNLIDVNTINTTENNDIILFHKIDVNTLKILNNEMVNKDNGYLDFSFCSDSLKVNLLSKKGKKILFVIKTVDNTIQHELTVKRAIVNDLEEHRKNIHIYQDFLVKRINSFKYDIKKGENILNVEHIGDFVSFMIMSSPEKMDVCLDINIETIISDENNNSVVVDKHFVNNLIETTQDPEYCKIHVENIHAYIFDVFENLKDGQNLINKISEVQPKGSIEIKQNSFIKINSEFDMSIDICYAIYDIICYDNVGQSKVYFHNQKYENIQLNPINEIENVKQNNKIIGYSTLKSQLSSILKYPFKSFKLF